MVATVVFFDLHLAIRACLCKHRGADKKEIGTVSQNVVLPLNGMRI
jgi:hypothetical protein